MRIGLVGPAEEEPTLLREAAEFLLGDCSVDQVVYLGEQATLQEVVSTWSHEVARGLDTSTAFLDFAVELALGGDAPAIDTLLARDRELSRLALIRTLRAAPARDIELFEDKVVMFVHDKSLLDQEDIANAFLIVYGRSKQLALHRFGPRTFFTPGPLSQRRVALLEREPDGNVALAQFDPHTGEPHGREILHGRRSRMVVTP